MISITAICRSSERRWRRSITLACVVTSSAVVGSSAMSSSGSEASAIAIITRCRMPPENSCGYWSSRARGVCTPTSASSSTARSTASGFVASVWSRIASTSWYPIVFTGFSDPSASWKIIAMRPPRTVRSVVVVGTAQLEVAEPDRAAGDPPGRLEQPEDSHRDRRLARPRLADDAEPLPGADREREVVDGTDGALLEREVDDETVDREDDVVVHAVCGSGLRRLLAHAAFSVLPPTVIGVEPGLSTTAEAPALPLRCTATSMPSLMRT